MILKREMDSRVPRYLRRRRTEGSKVVLFNRAHDLLRALVDDGRRFVKNFRHALLSLDRYPLTRLNEVVAVIALPASRTVPFCREEGPGQAMIADSF